MTQNTKVRLPQGGDSLVIASGGILDLQPGSQLQSGSKLGRRSWRPPDESDHSTSALRKLHLANDRRRLDRPSGQCRGGRKRDGQPPAHTAGIYLVEGVRLAGVLTGVSGLTSSAACVMSIGTTPAAADNGTLTGTEANILASQAVSLTSNNGVVDANNATPTIIDISSSGRCTSTSLFPTPASPGGGRHLLWDALPDADPNGLMEGFPQIMGRLVTTSPPATTPVSLDQVRGWGRLASSKRMCSKRVCCRRSTKSSDTPADRSSSDRMSCGWIAS